MPARGFVQALPPVVIHLAAIIPFHRLGHVTRVGVQAHPAGLFQGFQPQRRRDNLSLLVGGLAQIQSERAPETLISQQGHCRRTSFVPAIAETGTVTKDGYSLHASANASRSSNRQELSLP